MSSTPREDVYSKDSNLNLHQLKQKVPQAVDNNSNSEHDFSAPAQTHEFAALLFDMDGTIIDSTPAIVKYWHELGDLIGVPGDEILETSHGRRSIDVLSILAPEKANWKFVCEAEGRVPLEHGQDATEIPGARALLENLEEAGASWAIVTSGTQPLVSGWLGVMKLSKPKVLVSAEEVANGKPDPACYRLGAKRLGLDDGHESGFAEGASNINPSQILVLEDAPAGVRAGKAAGYKVVALATTHAIEKLREAGADWIVKDMRSVTMKRWDPQAGRVSIEIQDALVA
ncbi:DL-glycerol-3-phosphatase [Elasticomyces elasticus]|nr:DL-glycerol-3-phosphatase [Elasticomyces elasticus]